MPSIPPRSPAGPRAFVPAASTPLPFRLARLPVAGRLPAALACHEIRFAATPLARLRGLAGLRAMPFDCGLLLPRTRSIHTFGMRFALDLVWLDRDGAIVRVDRAVRPRRMRSCRRARAVVELAAGAAPAQSSQRKPTAEGRGASGLAGRPGEPGGGSL